MGARISGILAGGAALLALALFATRQAPRPEVRAPVSAGPLAREAPTLVPAPGPLHSAARQPQPDPPEREPVPLEIEGPEVSLEALLGVREAGPPERGLEFDRNPHLRGVPLEAGRSDDRDRLRFEHRSEELGPAGREITRSRTEVDVGVPIDESVELRGGLRVEQHEQNGGSDGEMEATPKVGVEVRF